MTRRASRRSAATLLFIVLCCAIGAVLPASGSSAAPTSAPVAAWTDGATVVALPNGSTAYVRRDGLAMVVDGTSVTYRRLDDAERYGDQPLATALPSKAELAWQLGRPTPQPYRPGEVVVTFADAAAVPAPATGRTGDPGTDAVLARFGVTAATAVLATTEQWRTAFDAAEAATGLQLLDPARTFRLALDGADPRDAALGLLDLPTVAYASPAWTVSAGSTGHVTVPESVVAAAPAADAIDLTTDGSWRLPNNEAIRLNGESHWNTPGLDAATAYHRITLELGELPGTGEIITTVGIGPVTSDPSGPCAGDVEFFGPTTTVIDNQRYLDLPSMPLVPTFTADETGALDPLGEACPIADPLLKDLGLAVSVMAPLPHAQQRPEAIGTGLRDLLGLAPGADYRLVVPADPLPTTIDLAGALLGAAQQDPPPTVITVSGHVGGDQVGFPNRTLEDDPLLRSILTTIVQGQDITVAEAAGDGITTQRPAAYGASGGAAETQLADAGDAGTTLSDLSLSTAPSRLPDSGSIMVGSTTLNDVFAAPPHTATDPSVRAQQAYPAVRWTGSTAYASAFGERVDLSAPGDSILGFQHTHGGGPGDVSLQLGSGTVVAAAQVAAAAAVVRQVSRATGQSVDDPDEVRALLTATGRSISGVPQALTPVDVGPQLDLGAAVGAVLDAAGHRVGPGVLRVAVAQRRPVAGNGAVFETWTDRRLIDLAGPPSPVDGTPTGRNARAWITVAPDWVGLPGGTTFILKVAGRDGGLLASTRSARVLPAEILAAAGLPLADDVHRDVTLDYLATKDGDVLTSATVTLGFGPSDGISEQVLAPEVDPVVTGDTIRVAYDLTDVAPVDEPELVVSLPGRPKPEIGPFYVPALTIPLDELVGTVDVPVADLDGGGLYGIAVHYATLELEGFPYPLYSDFAFTRLAPTAADRPGAPLLARVGVTDEAPHRHYTRLDADDEVRIAWDASAVPGAVDARLEISAAGPTIVGLRSTFNNPDGTTRDDNGNDTGSVALVDLPGVSGKTTFSPGDLGLYSAMSHGLRILAVDAGGAVVGVASAVSSVALDGVRLPSGTAEMGFGIDPQSRLGLVTTHRGEFGVEYASARIFDLDSQKIISTPLRESAGRTYTTLGSGVYGRTGLLQELQTGQVDPVGQWAVPGLGQHATDWVPPDPDRYVVELGGSDQASRRGAFVLRDGQDDTLPFRLVAGKVRADTFDPVRDISDVLGDLPASTVPYVMAYDRRAGVAGVAYAYDFFAAPVVELVDVATGDSLVVDHDGFLIPTGLDILAPSGQPGLVGFTTFDGRFTTADLDGGSARSVTISSGNYVTADDLHGLFLVAQVSNDPAGRDKNDLSSVVVLDRELAVVATLQRFNLIDSPLSAAFPQLQVDPTTRTGWFLGPIEEQLATFSY